VTCAALNRTLREIFSKHNPGFRGSTSIKAVLPVLCPELSYEGLAICARSSSSLGKVNFFERRLHACLAPVRAMQRNIRL
jgi:hypothetical protein